MLDTLRAGALLALLPILTVGTALDAQVRPDRSRQMRDPQPLCGYDECFHHTMFLDQAPQLSPVAGRTSASRDRLSFETQGAMNGVITWGNNVKRITIRERGDEPCHLELLGTEGLSTWSECGGSLGSTRSAGVDGAFSLVGIKVCNNGRSGERGRLVKGLELEWAVRPHETLASDRVLRTERLMQPNCSRWRTWVHCPAASAAQTVIVHHESIGGRRAIVGLQLECYPVRPGCFPASDPGWATYGNAILACRSGDR
jgi:hypothetical protein